MATNNVGDPIIHGNRDYAGIFVDENAGDTTISYQDVWVQIDVFTDDMPENISNGAFGTNNMTVGATAAYEVKFTGYGTAAGTAKTYEFSAFEITTTTATVQSNTEADPGVFTFTATHPFSTGDHIRFTGLNNITELNDQIFNVVDTGATTVSIKDEAGVDFVTSGLGVANTGTATLVMELDQVHCHRKWANQDIGSYSGCGIASLTKDNTLEMQMCCISDATDMLVEGMSFSIKKVG